MPSGKSAGFSYLGLMVFIAIAGIALAGIGQMSSMQIKREKEAQLLFVGDQFRRAIASYHQSTPDAIKRYPATLNDLLEDNRFPQPRRHLRQIYFDPITNSREWGMVEVDGRITGVYSLAEGRPARRAGFPERYRTFEEAKSYRDWKFLDNGTASKEPAAAVASDGKLPVNNEPPATAGKAGTEPGASGNAETSPPPPLAQDAPAEPPSSCQAQLVKDLQACRNSCEQASSPDCSACRRAAFIRHAGCQRQ